MSQETLLSERRKLGGLLVKAHSEIRRGVSFFRWDEGDAKTIVPSLYVPPGAPKTAAPITGAPDDLAAVHQQHHTDQGTPPPLVHPEDHPFAAE